MSRIAGIAACAALLAGCGSPTLASADWNKAEPAVSQAGVLVTVENDRGFSMQIHAERPGKRFLIGVVPPGRRATFPMPPIMMSGRGELRLIADPIGSTQQQRSQAVNLDGGRRVLWRLRRGGGDRLDVM